MGKPPKGKRGKFIYPSEQLCKAIPENYLNHGGLTDFFEEAGWNYLRVLEERPNTNTQTSINSPHLRKIHTTFDKVLNYLVGKFYEELQPGQQINAKHLKEAIISVRGSDPRTIKKWTKSFHEFGYIESIEGGHWTLSEDKAVRE